MAYTVVPDKNNGDQLTGTVGGYVDEARLAIMELQAGLPEDWTAYVPTLSGAGWALGSTGASAFGAYHRAGKLIHFHARLIFGTVGMAFGAGNPTVSLPTTSQESAGGLPQWNGVIAEYFDSSAGASYIGKGLLSGAAVVLGIPNVAATYPTIALVGSAVPMTWASSDEIRVSGWYRTS